MRSVDKEGGDVGGVSGKCEIHAEIVDVSRFIGMSWWLIKWDRSPLLLDVSACSCIHKWTSWASTDIP